MEIKTLRIHIKGLEVMLGLRRLLRTYEKVIPPDDACASQRLISLGKAAMFLLTGNKFKLKCQRFCVNKNGNISQGADEQ